MGMNAVNKMKSGATAMASKWAKDRKEGITGKLDRTSIKAQAGLGKTRLGQSKFGRMIGLDKPKSFRKKYRDEAKEAHKQRVEDNVMKKHGGVGGMEDRLNRGVFNWKGDKTNKQQLEHDRHIAEKRKEIQESPSDNNEAALKHRFETSNDNEEKEAILYELAQMHGVNSLTGGSADSEELKKLIIDNFGDGAEGKRISSNTERIGVNNKDAQWHGTTKTNIETGELEWGYHDDNKEEKKEQAIASAEMIRKKDGFNQINSLTKDAFEVKNGELTVGAGERFKATAMQLGKNYDRTGQRERDHFSTNVNAFKKFTDKEFTDKEIDPGKKRDMYQAISRMINPSGRGDELFKDGEIMDKDEADEVIKQYKEIGATGSTSTTNKKEVNHEEEVVKKEKTIEEINEVIVKDKEDQVKTAGKGDFNSDEYKQRKEKIEKNEQRVNDLKNEIQGEHRPVVAEQVVDSLNKEDIGSTVDMQRVGDELAQAVEESFRNIESGLDFTKATQGLDKFTDSLNEEIDKIKDDSKKPDMSFASTNNMNKVDNPVIQINMLKKLGEIAKKLGKKAGEEEA